MTTLHGQGHDQTRTPEPPHRPRRRGFAIAAAAAVVAVLVPVAVVSVAGAPSDEPVATALEPSHEPVPLESAPWTAEVGTPAVADDDTATDGFEPGPSATTAAPPDEDPDPGASIDGWTLVAQDDFGGTSLDPERWHVYEAETAGGVGQHLASNLSVADGVFTVTGRGNTSGGASWAPGQLHGRWEFRARADAATGYGPVVLLWPDAEDWPEGGEINIMEIPDPDRSWNRFTVHFGEDNDTLNAAVEGDFTEWNDYAVEWTPDHVAGFVNGVEYFRTTEPEAIPPRPMHLAVQQDIGPFGTDWIPARDETTPDEARLQIDWVRIYTM